MFALVFAGTLSGLASCAPRAAGLQVLDDLRRQGLVHDERGEIRPVEEPAPRARSDAEHDGLSAEGPLTLAMLLDAADRLNPRIAAARAAIGAAGGRAWNASLYPNPTLGVESENVRLSNGGFGASETTIGVTQPVIVSDRRHAAVAAGRARMNASEWQLAETRRDVHGRVRREATVIINHRDSIALHRDLIDLAERTLNIAAKRFEAGAAPESEAIRARVESNTLSLQIERLEGELAAAEARLSTLLAGRPIDVDRIDADSIRQHAPAFPDELEALREIVRTQHPAVRAAQADVEAAERQVELEQARKYPDVNARVGFGVDHAADESFIEAGVGVPLPIFDDNRGAVLAARFEAIRAHRLAESAADELAGSITEAFHRWKSAQRRLDAYERQILSGAQRSYDQTRNGYEAGKLPFLDLLDAQRTLIRARIARIELIRAVDVARAQMHAILGDNFAVNDSGEHSP